MAVIAAAGKVGISSDELCAQAVGGLMSDPYWCWVDARCAQGAADEIDNALNSLVGRQTVPLTPPPLEIASDGVIESAAQISG
ncbi:UNVERIFIED_ORG: hypothetical protein J2Y77_000946 [Pseudomonas lini]